MTKPDHLYHGLTATTWDLHRGGGGRWDDAQLFLDLTREFGQPVLDLGCATGRILLDFLNEGVDIDGLDNAPELLALCREKARAMGKVPTLYQQSLETMDLPRRYALILGPSSVFQLVTDPGAALAALKRIHHHLKPGGAFITMFAFDWREGEPLDTGWVPHFERAQPDGTVVRATTREWREPAKQWWHTEERFEVLRDGQVIRTEDHRRSPEGRWYSQAQARQLYEDAGFTRLTFLQEFTRTPATPADRRFTLLGVKP